MALDILHDSWGPYTHTEVENALKAYLAVLEGRINQAIQEGGVGLTDLSLEVQALLTKANTALQPENLAAWAKAQNKPGYTVSEITGVEGFQNLLAKLQDMDQKIQAAAQSGDDPDDEMSSTSENAVQNKVIKAYVDNLINGLIDGAPAALDTLKELADALGDNDDAISALVSAIASKISGIKTSDNTPLTPDSNGIVTLPPAGSTISPATAAPSMDGTANVGSSSKYAREDHVHPHDSSKLSKSDVSVETQGDGTVDINVGSGANKDTYTINLNHTHSQYQPLLTAGANITIATNSQTGNLEISATGGGSSGITGITINGNSVTVSGGVAPLTDIVQSSNVANIVVCASVTDYNNISPKDSNTLYLIKE